MMTPALLKTSRKSVNELSLSTIFHKAETEFKELEMMFGMLGWGELPGEIKIEIDQDVKGYIDELNGCYSTNCPFVQKRRERVDFWVNSYLDGICTLDTAVQALKFKR